MKNIAAGIMTKRICQVFACLICLFSTAIYANPRQTIEINNQLKASLESFIQENHLAGAVVSYTFSSKNPITLAAGYQSVEKKIPMSSNSYFEIGSVTKAFLASQIMQQVALGKITVQETLLQVAKNFPGKDHALLELVKQYPHLGMITLRQYLTHTSGIAQSLNSDLFIKEYNENPMGYWDSQQLIT